MKREKAQQYEVFKVKSSRLRNRNWELSLTPDEARANGEVAALSDSQVIRFVNEIRGNNVSNRVVTKLKQEISDIVGQPSSQVNTNRLSILHKKLDEMFFLQDYMLVVMEKMMDYDAASRSFRFNGMAFYRLYASSGGAKEGVVAYASERVFNELAVRLDNGRNLKKKHIPAKFEAYKALVSSSSFPVSLLKSDSIAVINDYEHYVNQPVRFIHSDDKMTIEEMPSYPLKVNINDGFGFISPKLAKHWATEAGLDYIPGGFCIRYGFTKGMLFVFDFHEFSRTEAKQVSYRDVWGHIHCDVGHKDIVLTSSMVKLWSSYDSLDHFLENNHRHGYTFSITRLAPKELEHERNMNYQFLQSLNLDHAQIEELVQPTISFIKDAMGEDWVKSVLFLKGTHLSDKSTETLSYDFAHALMLEPEMIHDPHVKACIKKMIKKTIQDAKIGKIRVKGNYSIISGDPYALAQHMFALPVTGLLREGEYYSRYWSERHVKRVAAFRAPMSCHENIRIFQIKDNLQLQKWYGHMNTITILNAWDSTMSALNGADFDGDQVLTTDSSIIINGVQELPAIVCQQQSSVAKVINEKDLVKANKAAKGDDIGSITNRATALYDLLPDFLPESREYSETMNRIRRCQKLQQDSIDRAKGIKAMEMPKSWYKYNANLTTNEAGEETDRDEFGLSILADKSPYFMIYRYDQLKKEYDDYVKAAKMNCLNRFGIDLDSLIKRSDKTSEQEEFLFYYKAMLPVTVGDSIMNRICRMIENEFGRSRKQTKAFDYSILKSGAVYSHYAYQEISHLYEEYQYAVSAYEQQPDYYIGEKNHRQLFKQRFRQLALELCSNEEELCNIVIDLVYSSKRSKQFAWDIAGETIIQNLRKRSGYRLKVPIFDPQGDIWFAGKSFSLITKKCTEGKNEVFN